jgi:hypothetical protein
MVIQTEFKGSRSYTLAAGLCLSSMISKYPKAGAAPRYITLRAQDWAGMSTPLSSTLDCYHELRPSSTRRAPSSLSMMFVVTK